ncbi:plant virulence effector HPE1-like domain-containing protein [Rhizobium sp. 32-5/1]|uniref:plant virulence effector HPE1-like domain-containing protein n=1 Tax=Rhizobium sp. 32-5/1 TaxID=3019602 RepID=UPI00240CF298|nr:plant virulence effector HPE1-like domain-containing protein [Rhizobium sp. 32-5/1]WEZ84207.1 plant virulence effector HPE1-like domain-containing protein [Rhizobium sp. 32-5/1]
MRHLVLTVSCVFAAGSAFASSIESVTTGTGDNNSIATVSCASCPPLIVKKKLSYIVPEVAKGTERVELKELNGKMKLVRTEAWLGDRRSFSSRRLRTMSSRPPRRKAYRSQPWPALLVPTRRMRRRRP